MTFRTEYLLNKHKNKKDTCYNQPEVKKLNHTQLQKKIYNIQYKINTLYKDSLKTENNTCLFCNKSYANKNSLLTHMNKYCKEKINLESELNKNKYAQNILEENNSQKKINKNIVQNITNNITNNNITNNNITNNNLTNNNLTLQIQVNSFGKEDLSHITLKEYKKYLNSFFPGFVNFIEKVHFDENAPANQNLCINNIKA